MTPHPELSRHPKLCGLTLCPLSVGTQNRDSLEARTDSGGLWARSDMVHTGETKERGR